MFPFDPTENIRKPLVWELGSKGLIYLKTEYVHSSSYDFLFSYNAFYCERKLHEMQRISNFQKNASEIYFCTV